jgi:hypothetical protein
MPAGRPKIVIDYNLAYKLAKRFATQEDIADIIGCSVKTLQRDAEFCRVFKKGKQQVYKNLRVSQYKHALNGNATLLIWLGKQYLQQRDPDKSLTQITDDVGNKLGKIADAISKQDTIENKQV